VAGERSMPRRPVVVTFDDGYADNLEVAAPILNHFGIRATFYVTVNCVDKGQLPWIARVRHAFRSTKKCCWQAPDAGTWPLSDDRTREAAFIAASEVCARLSGDAQERIVQTIDRELDVGPIPTDACRMLTWDQVRDLARGGHVIGSHTLSHPNLAHVGDDELGIEVNESKQRIEDQLGIPVLHLAYPNPSLSQHWTARTIAASQQVGYQTAVIATPGLVRKSDDLFCLHRVAASRELNAFRWNLESVFLGRRAIS
jgi:peptidoglycan/xylan/chitin deacetylase (PgdA/CDA1 family)